MQAREIQSSGLKPVRKELRHHLPDAVRAGAAADQRHTALAAEKQPGSLGSEEPFMTRHGDKSSAEVFNNHLKDPGRLRCIHDQRHILFPTELRDLPDRQNKAKDIGDHRADDKVGLVDPRLKRFDTSCRMEQRLSSSLMNTMALR